jgi:hypothetical protein
MAPQQAVYRKEEPETFAQYNQNRNVQEYTANRLTNNYDQVDQPDFRERSMMDLMQRQTQNQHMINQIQDSSPGQKYKSALQMQMGRVSAYPVESNYLSGRNY